MQALVIQLFASVAVSGFCIAAWALTSGTFEEAGRALRNPSLTNKLGFWPMWVIFVCAALLVVHLGVVVARFFSERAVRRRRKAAQKTAQQVADGAAALLGALTARTRRTRRPKAERKAAPTEPGEPSRRWVTVMFVDIVESTRLTEELGDDEWTQILARYRELVRAVFDARGGEEVGTQGDGFLAKFPAPDDAVQCAIEVQQDVRKVSAAGVPLSVRIGIHAGDAVHDDGDLVGRAVNLAARVTQAAAPGEILVTEPVADQVGTSLKLEDRGLRELKGIPQPRHVLAVVWD